MIEAPKNFRRANGVNLKNITFTNAEETLWSCKNINIDNVTAKGDYFAMNCSDMDFKTAPKITEAIIKRAEHGVFGYNIVPDEWYGAYMDWWETRHNFKMEKDWLIFCTGVVPAISSIVRKLTTPAENVLYSRPYIIYSLIPF